jgi:hypothetical protein
MPFPLLAAAIGGAGSLASAFIDKAAADKVAGVARRAETLGANASTQAGQMGATASTKAAGIGAAAAGKAAGQLSSGYRGAINQTQAGTQQALNFLAPYAKMGPGGMKLLSDALGINGPQKQAAYYQHFQTDPGYQATLNAGTNALEQSASAGGALRSGGTMKALFGYGQQQMQNQFQDRLARLLGLGQQGQMAATNQANISQAGSNNIAGYLSDIGGAQAGGTIDAANANMGGILGAANANIGGFLGATKARLGGMQNASRLNMYGQGLLTKGISDLAARFSGPLSQYAGNAFGSVHAPTPGMIF